MHCQKLGIAANLGNKVVCRQTFAHSSYAVIGAQAKDGAWDALPNADYWSSVLWRRLVGTKVLSVQGGLDPGRALRAYAFCTAVAKGGLTVVVLNTHSNDTSLHLELTSSARPAAAEVYMLSSYPGLLTSRDVFLNDNVLRLANATTGELPPLLPVHVVAGAPIRVPAKSYGFIVLRDAGVQVCGAQN